ncbi:hypothetical protein GOBAR_AA37170 [Gossypium barbadense]|uniref:Uncharacterized protein n=1 Tax=Gossypium barbadense TaxID=3634 RepID=A0A2P5VXI0_GOSBA|nr:hypothetical protein GOBAR_AA37170 [Gossypium barbadense]
MPFEPRANWFSPKCIKAQHLTGHLGGCRDNQEVCPEAATLERVRNIAHCSSTFMPKINRAKRFAEAVGCKNASGRSIPP